MRLRRVFSSSFAALRLRARSLRQAMTIRSSRPTRSPTASDRPDLLGCSGGCSGDLEWVDARSIRFANGELGRSFRRSTAYLAHTWHTRQPRARTNYAKYVPSIEACEARLDAPFNCQ